MSRKQFVCANLGFPVRRFHSIFSILLICNLVICITFLIYTMDPATAKKPRRAIGTQCNSCGKQFATSYAFDQHRRSGYLTCTGCHVLDDGSTRSLLVATAREKMSTAMLQKLTMKPKHHDMIISRVKEISTISNSLCEYFLDYLDCNHCIDHL
jgi:hypothetical protein